LHTYFYCCLSFSFQGGHQALTKQKTLFILEYFLICFYFHGHQKGAHLWQRGTIEGGATEVWGGQLPQTAPPLDPPLILNKQLVCCVGVQFKSRKNKKLLTDVCQHETPQDLVSAVSCYS